ncbi:hypothetical protein Pmani_014028 [Petrolisthes manimaculis]|uniref:Cyclin N-terminal domain-containing protein n=1 Tax=Petrolisthes manimaculis TaxID=1843537 RepID=A0AAE1UBH7_9EUCA|nr:hypothetical protein Pmani_014028 [Petrolisthes manimaculis]
MNCGDEYQEWEYHQSYYEHPWTHNDQNTRDHIKDLIKVLEAENEREMSEVHPALAFLDITSIMSVIVPVTQLFSLSQHVKYIALEIFQRYMTSHMNSLLEHVTETTNKDRKRERLIKAVEKNVADQSPLRLMTCIMIASKLFSHKKHMTPQMCQKYLKRMKVVTSARAVIRSERNILEQIDSRLYRRSSMVVYVGMMVWLGGLGGGDLRDFRQGVVQAGAPMMDPKQLFSRALCVLNVVYMKHEEVYLDLYTILSGFTTITNDHRAAYSHVMADRMLLGAAVVAAAGLIAGSESMCAVLVATFSHHITRISKRDILTLASCIVRATGLAVYPLDLLATP